MKKNLILLTLISIFSDLYANEGDTITYRSKNNLEWTDFRMDPDLKDTSKIHLNVTIVTFTKKVDIWFGIIKVESFAGVRRDISWVKPDYKTDKLIAYIQLKYDIANYYAKKAENEINSKKINVVRKEKIRNIIDTNINEMKKTFKIYDSETNFGNDQNMLDKWRLKLLEGNI